MRRLCSVRVGGEEERSIFASTAIEPSSARSICNATCGLVCCCPPKLAMRGLHLSFGGSMDTARTNRLVIERSKADHWCTDTKEKPFLCRCGAAFTRRDLLTRHYRLSKHGDEPPVADVAVTPKESEFDRTAAAESLSCLSGANVQPWPAVHHPPPVDNAFGDLDQRHADGGHTQDVYQQSFLGPQMFNQGAFPDKDSYLVP